MEQGPVIYNPNASGREFVLSFRSTRDFPQALPIMFENEELRNEIFEQIGHSDYPIPEYSSWLTIHFFQKFPELFTKEWCDQFISTLLITENHTVQRNVCTILFHYKGKLNENSELLDRLFNFLLANDSLPALRIHALKNIELHYLSSYPELLNELFSAIDLLKQHNTPSLQATIRNFLKKYNK